MPLDLIRRLTLPFRNPVETSRYPESAPLIQFATRGMPEIDPALCQNDGACVTACPTGAIKWTAGRVESIDAGKCIFCAACVAACPHDAMSMTPLVELAARTRDGLVRPTEGPALSPSAGVESLLTDQSAAEHVRIRVESKLGRSLHVRHLDAGSCNGCDWEIAALLNPYHDVQRLGIDFVASPRHADLLLVTGVMTPNLAEAARRTYEAMPEPRLVVAVGACAIDGGVFAGAPGSGNGVGGAFPVDVFVAGCPPRPEAIIEGMLMALEKRG
jgi:Ni,Fe-hydrogenase III small subunit/formate hydrogenlyase subunit 6/NADH:ubiquinone oxidoreductase subunit I